MADIIDFPPREPDDDFKAFMSAYALGWASGSERGSIWDGPCIRRFTNPDFPQSPAEETLERLNRIEEKLDRLLNPHVWGRLCPDCKKALYRFEGRWVCLYCKRIEP